MAYNLERRKYNPSRIEAPRQNKKGRHKQGGGLEKEKGLSTPTVGGHTGDSQQICQSLQILCFLSKLVQ